MYVSAVSSFFNPYDVARVAGVQARNEQTTRNEQANSRNPSQVASSQERVVQGEVISRQRIQNQNTSSTNDTLSNRQFNRDQSGFGFNSRQAINTYIGNQLQGDRIDQRNTLESTSLIDVYV